jgi:hypothetical protein
MEYWNNGTMFERPLIPIFHFYTFPSFHYVAINEGLPLQKIVLPA